ncbi:MAG TPA: choice-of-anchor Q domain-containing protein [Polyangia bacterium]|nr:choice-of-anchor Q domain-containing protein [Polyangia bacterium]
MLGRVICLAFGISLALTVLLRRSAECATFNVNTPNDTHDFDNLDGLCRDASALCSLRAAIEQSNQSGVYTSINLAATTYILSLGQLQATGDIDIIGSQSSPFTKIDARGMSRVLEVNTAVGAVGLYSVTLQNGNGTPSPTTQPGGQLYQSNGQVMAFDSTFTTTMAVSSKPFPGAGIALTSFAYIERCTISKNETPNGGGGVQDTGGGLFLYSTANAYVYDSTISENKAVRGAGIGGGGTLNLFNSTVSGNTARGGGGGLRLAQSGANWYVAFSTITNNTANVTSPDTSFVWGGGVLTTAGVIHIGKTIIAKNTDNRISSSPDFSPDCGMAPTGTELRSYSDLILGRIGSKCTNFTIGYDFVGWSSDFDPRIGALGSGGSFPPLTHMPALNSSAVDEATSGNGGNAFFSCPSWDERSASRPWDGNNDGVALCDIGSVER